VTITADATDPERRTQLAGDVSATDAASFANRISESSLGAPDAVAERLEGRLELTRSGIAPLTSDQPALQELDQVVVRKLRSSGRVKEAQLQSLKPTSQQARGLKRCS